jgi:hypothetical protein
LGLQIWLPGDHLGNILLHLGYVVSRTTVEVSHVDAGEHMVPGQFTPKNIFFKLKNLLLQEEICYDCLKKSCPLFWHTKNRSGSKRVNPTAYFE